MVLIEIEEKRIADSTYNTAGHYTFNGIVPWKEAFLCKARSEVCNSSEDKDVSEVGFELMALFGHEGNYRTEHIEDHSVGEVSEEYDGESFIHNFFCYYWKRFIKSREMNKNTNRSLAFINVKLHCLNLILTLVEWVKKSQTDDKMVKLCKTRQGLSVDSLNL